MNSYKDWKIGTEAVATLLYTDGYYFVTAGKPYEIKVIEGIFEGTPFATFTDDRGNPRVCHASRFSLGEEG